MGSVTPAEGAWVRIVVDRGRCVGMGICESVAPDHFEIGDDGAMSVLRDEADTLTALAAVGSCPAASLSLSGAGVGVDRLTWGVKESFVAYVRAVGGSVVADGGAREDGGTFVFPAAPSSAAALEWRFAGRLAFRAHEGLLDVQLCDPWVRLAGEDLELTVADDRGIRLVAARGRSDGPLNAPVPVELASGAGHLFGATYPTGTPLAPLVLSPNDP